MIELQEARRSDDVAMALPPVRYDVDVVPEVVEGLTIYVASHPELPHVRAQGLSVQQAIEDLVEVADAYLADMVTAGIAVPPAKDQPRMRTWTLVPSSTPKPDRFEIQWRIVQSSPQARRGSLEAWSSTTPKRHKPLSSTG